MGLSVDTHAGEHAHLRRPLTSANSAIQQEFAVTNSSIGVRRSGLNKPSRNFVYVAAAALGSKRMIGTNSEVPASDTAPNIPIAVSGPVSSMTGLRFAKSTRISKRSAGEILSCIRATGAERNPASDAMT